MKLIKVNDRIMGCRIIGVLHYCHLLVDMRKACIDINQANRAKERWATVIGKNEVLETDGSSGREESHALQLIYISSAWVGPVSLSVANRRKLFNSFTRAAVSVSGTELPTDLSKRRKKKEREKKSK